MVQSFGPDRWHGQARRDETTKDETRQRIGARQKARKTFLLFPLGSCELETVLIGNDGTVYTKDKPREPKGIKDEALKKAMYQAQVD